MELSASYRLSVDYRLLYIKERLNYLVPLYLVGAASLGLLLINVADPWGGVYIGFVSILGLTISGKVFINAMRRGFKPPLDIYDLDLDLLIVSIAVSLIVIKDVLITMVLLIITSMSLFTESLVIYNRARKKIFDIGIFSIIIYSVPLLALSFYSMYFALTSIIILIISSLIMALFLMNLGLLILKRMHWA